MNEGVRNEIIASLAVMAVGGIAHIFWQTLGWPCLYPIVRAWALRQWRNQKHGSSDPA